MSELLDGLIRVLAFFGGYALQAVLFFAAAFVVVVVGLGLLLSLRFVLRRVAPYESPPFGQYRGFRYWLENL